MRTSGKLMSMPASQGDERVLRADRLLRGFRRLFIHDLPNQLVVLQSLLQLLAADETSRLSDDGREFLCRLQSATHQAGELVRFAKEMTRISELVVHVQPVPLAELARDIEVELRRRRPALALKFSWRWDVASVPGDARALLAGILELLVGTLDSSAREASIHAESRRAGDAVEVGCRIEKDGLANRPTDDRFEFLLAREWLALCGAELTILRGDDVGFIITTPER